MAAYSTACRRPNFNCSLESILQPLLTLSFSDIDALSWKDTLKAKIREHLKPASPAWDWQNNAFGPDKEGKQKHHLDLRTIYQLLNSEAIVNLSIKI
jgi:hypothetical protein